MTKSDLIYIASPYSTSYPEISTTHRYQETVAFVSQMLSEGYHVISPIVHCHHAAIDKKLGLDFAFWKDYNTKRLLKCTCLCVLMLPHWEESVGVQAEIDIARSNNIPIVFKLPIP